MNKHQLTIDPQKNRAWFLLPDGELFGALTHRGILENDFETDWSLLKNNDKTIDSYRIEEVLEHRLLKIGAIKIGVIKDKFYIDMQYLTSNELNLLQDFSISIIKACSHDISHSKILITVKSTGLVKSSYTLQDLADGTLFSLLN